MLWIEEALEGVEHLRKVTKFKHETDAVVISAGLARAIVAQFKEFEDLSAKASQVEAMRRTIEDLRLRELSSKFKSFGESCAKAHLQTPE